MKQPTPARFKNIVTGDRGRIFWNQQRQAFPSVFPDLSGLPMANATFRGWNFSGVDFTECDLSGSRFIGCDFRGACFHDVVMEGEHSGDSLEADLDGAFFEACDLRSSLMPPRWAREFEALRADAKLAELHLSLPLLRLRNVADFGVCECGALHAWTNAEPAPTVCNADNARPSGGGCGQEIEAARLSRKPEDLRASVEAGRLRIRLGAHDAIGDIDPDDSRAIVVAFRDDLAAIEATTELIPIRGRSGADWSKLAGHFVGVIVENEAHRREAERISFAGGRVYEMAAPRRATAESLLASLHSSSRLEAEVAA